MVRGREVSVVMEDDALQKKCDLYELLYLRATEGARAANRGIERLKRRIEELNGDLRVAHSLTERTQRQVFELEKKVQRLSLRIINEWGEKSEPR